MVPKDWSQMGPAEHFAQFYESEAFLLEALQGYVRCGLTTVKLFTWSAAARRSAPRRRF